MHTPRPERADAATPASATATSAATQRPALTHAAPPAQLVQQAASVSSTLAAYASDDQGHLSPYVLGADVLAGVAAAGSLLLAELRRRRLV